MKPEEINVAKEPEVLFFGCIGQAGHYLNSKKTRIRFEEQPWRNTLDTGLLKGVEDSPNGKYVVAKKDGWTCISFWDRSGGDTRPGCNSAFLVAADVSAEKLFELSRQQWPEVWNRPNFPIGKWVETKGEGE